MAEASRRRVREYVARKYGRPERAAVLGVLERLLFERQVADLLQTGGDSRIDRLRRFLTRLRQDLRELTHRRHALLEGGFHQFRLLRREILRRAHLAQGTDRLRGLL